MMRIITGKAKGVRLDSLPGDSTRPTMERTKEAVFSSLQYQIQGCSVLDLFAGSGQMGLEALSRGAAKADFADCSEDACGIVRRNLEKTKLSGGFVYRSDWKAFLSGAGRRYDLVYLDPPFSMHIIRDILHTLLDYDSLNPGAYVVCETDYDNLFEGDAELEERFDVKKSAHYSFCRLFILQRRE